MQEHPTAPQAPLLADIARALGPGRARHFYTLVHTLSRLAGELGEADAPSELSGVYFAHAGSLCFEAQEVCRVSAAPPGRRAAFEVESTFLGLSGTVSPLPQVLADSLIQPDIPGPLSHFFASVHHRLIQLLVSRYLQTHAAMTRRSNYEDAWSQRLLAWTPHAAGLSSALRWRYLQPLMRATPCAADLTGVLQDALARRGIAARLSVVAMTGGFVPLDADQTCVLGQRQHKLGVCSVMGGHAWAPQSAFCLDIYPETRSDCLRLRQDPQVHQQVHALIGALAPLQTRCDVHVWVQPSMSAATRLDGLAALGQASWLGLPKQQVRLPFHKTQTQTSAPQ